MWYIVGFLIGVVLTLLVVLVNAEDMIRDYRKVIQVQQRTIKNLQIQQDVARKTMNDIGWWEG
jgi:heme/copper-type cytochrome/quinol oxidase subunit 4